MAYTCNKRAFDLVYNAVKRGILVKPDRCEFCVEDGTDWDNTGKLHAHHSDYNQPLDVIWLCSKHHRLWHKQYKAVPYRDGVSRFRGIKKESLKNVRLVLKCTTKKVCLPGTTPDRREPVKKKTDKLLICAPRLPKRSHLRCPAPHQPALFS